MIKKIIFLICFFVIIIDVYWKWEKCWTKFTTDTIEENLTVNYCIKSWECGLISLEQKKFLDNYKNCPFKNTSEWKEKYYKILYSIKNHWNSILNSQLSYSWKYEVENKIDDLIKEIDQENLLQNWEKIIIEIDLRLKENISEEKKYILNYIKESINVNKVTYLREETSLPLDFSSLKESEKWNYTRTFDNNYTKEKNSDKYIRYRLWIWDWIGTKVLKLNKNIEIYIVDTFYWGYWEKSYSTLQIKQNWVFSNKVNVNTLSSQFTQISLDIYPNWDIIYNDWARHETESLEYLFISHQNEIYDLYTDLIIPFLGENIIKFHVKDINDKYIKIQEHWGCCYYEENKYWLENLIFDKKTFKLLDRTTIRDQ